MKHYKAEYADEEMECFQSENESDALGEAWSMEREHGILFNLFELDEDYNEIKAIL